LKRKEKKRKKKRKERKTRLQSFKQAGAKVQKA